MIKAVIFDMDGVLLDTESLCFECWRRAGNERGLDDADEAYRLCIGSNTNDTMDILHKRYGSAFDAWGFYARTGELFHIVEAEQGLALMPYVTECLTALKEAGYRLAVASSTRSEAVHRQLSAAGIIGYFETITCGDTVKHSKPAPDIYLKACESLHLAPEDCLAVEDSPNGVRSASVAGLRCVMVPDQIQPSEEIRALAWKVVEDVRGVAGLL
mgnify:CR=1 FL=1